MSDRVSNPSIPLLPLFAIFLLFLPQTQAKTPGRQISSTADSKRRGDIPKMSDREKSGLRGPVAECTEERTTPPVETHPGIKVVVTTNYDRQGRIARTSTTRSFGSNTHEFVTTNAYDEQRRLLKTAVTYDGGPLMETNYRYDDAGRLIAVSGNDGQPTTFQYDDEGRKTRVMPAPPGAFDVETSAATSFPAPEGEDPYLPIPLHGQMKTSFNERDQPVEWRVFDGNGTLLSRLIRSYDDNGRVLETSYTIENFISLLPVESRKEFMSQAGVEEQLAKSLDNLLGAKREFIKFSYTYDATGRLAEKRQGMGASMETVTATTYNEHSDKLKEVITQSGDPNISRGSSPGDDPNSMPWQRTEKSYSYHYDNFGNWTEQTMTQSPSPAEPTTITRVLKYF
jgi:YD repeat-containing protein